MQVLVRKQLLKAQNMTVTFGLDDFGPQMGPKCHVFTHFLPKNSSFVPYNRIFVPYKRIFLIS